MTGVSLAPIGILLLVACLIAMRSEPLVSMVVESASLRQDGVAAVGSAIVSAIAAGASPSVAGVVPAFLWTLGGGVVIGLAISGAILLIVGRADDPLGGITLSTLAAYGSFLLAEEFHASGIIAALAAGLLVGNVGWSGALSEEGGHRVRWAWEYIPFLANSFVFILI